MKSFGHDLITHTGGIRGFCSAIMRYPEDRTLVIVLENMEPEEKEGDPELVEPLVVANGLSAIAFGLPPNTDPVSVTLHDQEPHAARARSIYRKNKNSRETELKPRDSNTA